MVFTLSGLLEQFPDLNELFSYSFYLSSGPEFLKLIKLALNVLININLVKLPNYP